MKISVRNSHSKRLNLISWIVLLAILIVIVSFSCQQDTMNQPPAAQVKANAEMTAKDNSQIVATTQDVLDMTAGAMAGQGVSNGRTSSYGKMSSSNLDCAPTIIGSFTIDRSHVDSLIVSGSLTIDFGTGVACKDSTEIRKGKIKDSFVLIKKLTGMGAFLLKETVTFDGFQKDSIKVDGSFIATSSSALVSTLDIQNARITYADGTFVTWSGNLTDSLRLQATVGGHHGDDGDQIDTGSHNTIIKSVTGSLVGTSRTGANFSAKITKPVLFKYSCSRHIPVSGSIDLTQGSVQSTVDYGTGTCDKIYTITTGGVTTEYTFKRHHQST